MPLAIPFIRERMWDALQVLHSELQTELRTDMSDLTVLILALGFAVSCWLLIVLSDALMGDKP